MLKLHKSLEYLFIPFHKKGEALCLLTENKLTLENIKRLFNHTECDLNGFGDCRTVSTTMA